MDFNLLTRCKVMLDQALTHGGTPVVFIMNKITHQALTDLATVQVRDKQSRFKRWYFQWRKKQLTLLAVFGVPVVENLYMPDGMVSLQLAPTPQGIQAMQNLQAMQQGQPSGPGAPTNPFAQPMRIEEAPEAEKPLMQDLAESSGKLTPTDVLIKGMEGLDRVKHVAVLRIYQNGDIDASTNLEPLELTGAIQKFQIWAMQQGSY